MKFLLDINLPPSLGLRLTEIGHSHRCVSAFMGAKSMDSLILQEAIRSDEVILTHDNDFGTLLSFSGEIKPSVILFRIHKISADKFFTLIDTNWQTIEQPLQEGSFVVFEEDKLRIRRLPIKR